MQFLICQDEIHADFIDHFIMARLRDVDGAQGASWSGIFVDYGTPTRYAVLWAAPASSLFGQPYDPETGEGDPAVVVVEGEMVVRDAQGQFVSGNWERFVPQEEAE